MTAEEAARDWLTASGVTYDKHDVRSLTALILTRERAARVEALGGAERDVRHDWPRWGDRWRQFAAWLAARAEEEGRG